MLGDEHIDIGNAIEYTEATLDVVHLCSIFIFEGTIGVTHTIVDLVVLAHYLRLLLGRNIFAPVESLALERVLHHHIVESGLLWVEFERNALCLTLHRLEIDHIARCAEIKDKATLVALAAIGNEIEQRAMKTLVDKLRLTLRLHLARLTTHQRAIAGDYCTDILLDILAKLYLQEVAETDAVVLLRVVPIDDIRVVDLEQ